MKILGLLCVAATVLLGVCARAGAALPPDFPQLSILRNTNPAPGYLFGNLCVGNVPGYSSYFAILDNDGSPILLNQTNRLGELACNGLFVSTEENEGQPVRFLLKDGSFNVIATNQAGNGYVADPHDFQVLPNGHALILIADSTPVLDMSKLVPGGFPAAPATQAIIQEVDVDGHVVFQWRSLDHIPVTDSYQDLTAANLGDYIDVNSLWFDETDGNIILSCRNTSEVIKISRATGDVVWRLQGQHNQFTFTNAIAGNSDPAYFQVQHHARRLPNGNLTIYDNGYSQDSDPAYGFTRPYSRAVEYVIDETSKSASLVWQYRHSPDIITYNGGSVDRLASGHTVVHWGTDNTASPQLAMTEADAEGGLVCEVALPQAGVSGNLTRMVWPLESSYVTVTKRELIAGNTYVFNQSDTNVTGVTIQVIDLTADQYNSVAVSMQPFAPVLPRFSQKAPRVVKARLEITPGLIDEMTAVISFDINQFALPDPTNTTVYYRPTPGEGPFVPLSTGYNWYAGQLQAYMTGFGEFIFGFPDLAEVPYPPILSTPASDAAVNQELPVSFSWTPKGFASSYYLQVSTNADFSTLLLDQPGLTESRYTNFTVAANTRYYWRVNTSNDGGDSDWATNTFTTVPPLVQVVAPNGGEVVQLGLPYVIQWQANVAEEIALDLYRGGSLVTILATNAANALAYTWQVSTTNVPGNDYTIQIRSTTNPALFDFSDQPFSIDMVPVTVDTLPTGLAVIVDGTNYTAPAPFDWVIGSSHSLSTTSPQGGDGHIRYAFSSWSDAGLQTHSITAPDSGTTYTATFSPQYLLDTAVAPIGAGTISNYPAGPWYDAGQLVSLTARTNTGYRTYFWQGVDSGSSNTAQVTMNGYHLAQANFVPSDYPYVLVTNYGGAAPGDLIGNFGGRTADGTKTYYVVLDNTGTNIIYANKTNILLRFVTPQGYVTDTDASGFRFKDESLTNIVETSTTLGYALDTHDVKLFPNGHSLVFGSEVRTFDLSGVVPGGKTAASVTGDIIQELDANKRVVFEWHTFDYIPVTNTFADMTQASFDYAHLNAMNIDPTDNNLLASLRTTSEIVKINRQTGQVMWRLGGKKNMFTFIGEHPENAPYYTVGQHDIHRLANGNLLYFDNGNISGGGVTPNDRTYTRAVEYALDEVAMTATLVWEYRHTPDISTPCTGSVKRFPNGNTLIDWGCAVPTSGYMVTEVNAAGQIVFEMKHWTNSGVGSVLLGGGLTKQWWNTPDLIRSAAYQGIQSGQTYDATAAGVAVTINDLSGTPDNTLLVRRCLDAVRSAKFSGQAPQVVMEHVVLSGSNIASLEARLDLSLPDTSYAFDTPVIHDPSQVTVYQRATPGQGQFAALPTTYDTGTQKLRVTTTQLGEFIFGYPDVSESLAVPAILSPADQSQVNQSAPVTLSWTVQGLISSFDLQLSTNADFSNPVVNTNGLGSMSFVQSNVAANTQYYWRVRAVNQAGAASAWASASFFTAPPFLQVTFPVGGEVWQRFQVVTITWVDNIAENVALDLYADGVSNRTFVASTASSGSYTWTVGQFSAIPFGTNYTIKIRSVINPGLYSFSQPFAIITNLTKVTIATAPTNLTVSVDGTNYTAPAVFNWLPRSSHSVNTTSPQVASDGHSRSVFASWSDGGYQSHSMAVPFSALTNTASFSTNYLLEVTTTPTGAGTAAANPAGPWYDVGQLVSLTANTNAGYLFYTWQGVDSQVNNTAELTMNGYQAVQARFIPTIGVPAINTASFVRLPDGRVQFTLTAGAGLATQATVWRATLLTPPDWTMLATVPLTNGQGVFTDSTAPRVATRFYRVTLP